LKFFVWKNLKEGKNLKKNFQVFLKNPSKMEIFPVKGGQIPQSTPLTTRLSPLFREKLAKQKKIFKIVLGFLK